MVPPWTEVVATLSFTAHTPGFEFDVEIYVEDFKGLTVLKLKARGEESVARGE